MWTRRHALLYLSVLLAHQIYAAPTPQIAQSLDLDHATPRNVADLTMDHLLLENSAPLPSVKEVHYTLHPVSEIFFEVTQLDYAFPTATPTPTAPSVDHDGIENIMTVLDTDVPNPTLRPSVLLPDRTSIYPGPGLVLLSSAFLPPQGTFPPISGATPSPETFNSHGHYHSLPVTKVEVVGGVIGGVAAISLCLFFLLDPRVSRGCRSRTPKSNNTRERPVLSWMRFPPPSTAIHPQSFADTEKESDCSFEKDGALSPRSKFSVTSSDYTQSSRDSAATYEVVIKPQTHSSIAPVRPPRPPTADSPATISDSVYFACESQQDAGAQHPHAQCADTATMNTGVSNDEAPLLSPMVFFTISPPSSPDPAILSRRDHSRTHSAPSFKRDPKADYESDSFMDPVARRVLKHRRSRSASGWAYSKSKNTYEPSLESVGQAH